MRKTVKNVVALGLATCMVLGLAACSNNGKVDTSDAATGNFTYHGYQSALADNWNPHTWEDSADDAMIGYLCTPLVDMSVSNTETEEWTWVYEAATDIEDVTADHQDDLDKYACTLPEGKTSADVTEGYVWEITLNPEMRWEDGTVINADSYIYSMQQLLNPDMLNSRASTYISGDYALAGANDYYYSNTEGYYVAYTSLYDSLAAVEEAGAELYINVWDFWGAQGYTDAEGNTCPQYVSVNDETVYGESVGDAFSGAEIWEYYGAYFEVGVGYEDYAAVYAANENMGVTFDTVGFYKVDDYTVRYVGATATEKNLMLGQFASPFLVYEDLYESLKDTTGDLVTTSYCTSKDTTMSYGVYKLESFQDAKQMVFVQNEEWYGFEKTDDGYLVSYTNFDIDGEKVQQYQTTKVVIDVMTDDAAKQAFLKGELDSWTPSSSDLVNYSLSDQMYKTPETYTERLFFDTDLEDLQEMDNSKGNTNSVVMSNENFRKAFSLSVDRSEWVGVTPGFMPSYSLLNSLYYYDVYNDPTSIYRNTDAAMQAICNVYDVEYGDGKAYATLEEAYNSLTGYNLTEAKELMATACAELVEAGLYTEGEDIVIRVAWMAGGLDSTATAEVSLLEQYLNAAVEGSGFGKVTLEPVGNLTDRYADVANGEYAIGFGAWGGAAFYPFTYFEVYCDPDSYSLHEAACWDPATEELTLTVNGEEVTMTWQAWSQCMEGVGKFANADNDTKVQILADLEENFIEKYYCFPLASMTTCEMISYKASYFVEDYNIMYGYGGLRLLQYNYTDEEWDAYVAEQGGTLSYE